jgi:hypothetical protein
MTIRALWRCCSAVVNASQTMGDQDLKQNASSSSHPSYPGLDCLFLIPRNLKIYPTKFRGAAVRTKNGVSTAAEFADLRHYVEATDGHGKYEGIYLVQIIFVSEFQKDMHIYIYIYMYMHCVR